MITCPSCGATLTGELKTDPTDRVCRMVAYACACGYHQVSLSASRGKQQFTEAQQERAVLIEQIEGEP